MALTSNLDTITQKVVDVLTAALVPGSLVAVYYGDEEIVPSYPAVVVIPQRKRRDYDATHKFQIIFDIDVVVLHEAVTSSTITTKSNIQLSETVQSTLDADRTMATLVIFSLVATIQPGIVRVNQSVMAQSTRLQWQAESRETF